jgi:hypothetical protein
MLHPSPLHTTSNASPPSPSHVLTTARTLEAQLLSLERRCSLASSAYEAKQRTVRALEEELVWLLRKGRAYRVGKGRVGVDGGVLDRGLCRGRDLEQLDPYNALWVDGNKDGPEETKLSESTGYTDLSVGLGLFYASSATSSDSATAPTQQDSVRAVDTPSVYSGISTSTNSTATRLCADLSPTMSASLSQFELIQIDECGPPAASLDEPTRRPGEPFLDHNKNTTNTLDIDPKLHKLVKPSKSSSTKSKKPSARDIYSRLTGSSKDTENAPSSERGDGRKVRGTGSSYRKFIKMKSAKVKSEPVVDVRA